MFVSPPFPLLLTALALVLPLEHARAQSSVFTLTADTASPLTVRVSPDAFGVRFTVTYLGTDSVTVEVACGGGGAVACVPTPAGRLQLGPGGSSVVAFGVRATRSGRGVLMARVRDLITGARASAALLVTVTP